MRIKIIFISLTGLFFFISHPSNALESIVQLIPFLKNRMDDLHRILSIIQVADIGGLDTLNCFNTIKDSASVRELERQIAEKRAYLVTELLTYRRAEEEKQVQNLLHITKSVDVLNAITPDKELLDQYAYEDIITQISWKKQIIQRQELESAYIWFRFFGTEQYVPVNKTINENLPAYYFICQEANWQNRSVLDEKLCE